MRRNMPTQPGNWRGWRDLAARVRSELYRVTTACKADLLRLDMTTPDAAYARAVYDETVKRLCYTAETVKLYRKGRLLESMQHTAIGAAPPWP